MRNAAVILTIALLAACNHGPTGPTDNSGPHGRLSGVVTIGPNCPVQTQTQPCPTPPSAYAARKILIYTADKSKLLFTVDIDSQGLYAIDLTPGDYVVDLKPNGIDRSSDVPRKVTILANLVTKLDITIDTGLR